MFMNREYFRTVFVVMLLLLVTPLLATPESRAQQVAKPKRVVVLYWYDKNFVGHVRWDQGFNSALDAAPKGSIEYYPEYLEANRFPGANQSQILQNYLKQKYADLPPDVVVAQSEVSLDFLIKYKDDLFPQVPVVFYSGARPNLTGVVVYGGFKKTIDFALAIQPQAEQVFVISGSLDHDKRFETTARAQLTGYEERIKINYLTDLSPAELRATIARLPERSLILYVWQQALDERGKLLESVDILSSISEITPVPIYGMSSNLVGRGIVGGYVYTPEAGAARVAEITLLIAGGRRAQDIPVESIQTIPMFDWHELQRWQISENKLPAGSLVEFRQFTVWQQYKWRILGVLALLLLQTAFITVLLLERGRRRRAKEALDQLNAELESRIEQRTAALNAKSRELEAFAYSVAHDLKAPLRGIDGYSRLLLEDYADLLEGEGRDFLQTIQSSTDEMNQLIDDLLAYSRLERRELQTDRIALAPIVNSLVEEKRREQARPVDFVVDV